MRLKQRPLLSSDKVNELQNMFVDHFEYSIKDIHSYDDFTSKEKEIIPRWLFDEIAEKTEKEIREEKIAQRLDSNLSILALLEEVIRSKPHLRFNQLLEALKVSEPGKDKFNEESVDTLSKLKDTIKSNLTQ